MRQLYIEVIHMQSRTIFFDDTPFILLDVANKKYTCRRLGQQVWWIKRLGEGDGWLRSLCDVAHFKSSSI